MSKIIHSMIRVFNPDISIEFYSKAFNLEIAERCDFDGFSLIYLGNTENDVELELTYNHDQTEPYTHGSGYGHLAFVVDDIETEHKRLNDLGFNPQKLVSFNQNGKLFAKFFFIKDPDGYEIEVLQRHGRFK
jgi:lactoylglutathione lyase